MGSRRERRQALHPAGTSRDGEVAGRRQRIASLPPQIRVDGAGLGPCDRAEGRAGDRSRHQVRRGDGSREGGRRARRRHDGPGLGARDEACGGDRHQPGRTHVSRGDHRTRARYSRGGRVRRRDAGAGRRRAGDRVVHRRRHGPRLRRHARGRGHRGRARPDAARADEAHDERRQSGARVRVPPPAERRCGARPPRIHHQQERRRASEGAARARSPAARAAARNPPADRRICEPDRVLREQGRRGRGDDRRGVLAEEGDRAPLRLQVERVFEPRRRPALRAARGKSDARVPRRVALHRAVVPRLLRARMRGAEARARRRWGSPTSS